MFYLRFSVSVGKQLGVFVGFFEVSFFSIEINVGFLLLCDGYLKFEAFY